MQRQRTTARLTRADYDRLPEECGVQLVEGAFVREPSPSFDHQAVVVAIVERLLPLVDSRRIAPAPVDVRIDEWNVFQPDVAVYARAVPRGTKRAGTPVLVVEVLSPATEGRDREPKTRMYLTAGVREVWLVEPRTGRIEVHTAGGSRTYGAADSVTSCAVPGFTATGRDLIR